MIINNKRNTNIELFRIITMFFIIAHHYVVNSGLYSSDSPLFNNIHTYKSIFLLVFGAWGKVGINCFMLITGYYMCVSSITLRKILKITAQYIFYKIVIYLIFIFTGYISFNIADLAKAILPVYTISHNFTSCYLLFILLIPFLNILIHNLNQKQHAILLLWCFFAYVLLGTFHRITFNYISWYTVIYLISSYIRLHPSKMYNNTKMWGLLSLMFITVSVFSILICVEVGLEPYYFITDSNTMLAVIVSLCMFLFFLNIKIKHNSFINTVSATTYGVLCIHANGDVMRRWLWKDTLNNIVAYYGNVYIHSILSVFVIFVVCSIIDYYRIKLLESVFLKWLDNTETMINKKLTKLVKRINIKQA